ncbi:MAG: hypoxanthine phosphoribosyltransferase [Bacteroidales bacterium]|nr:hypoxanthine phosphoribosyltransferase [Bacteroidales bacterium]MCF8406177.1 hypoxanthine phosphoribosyltransferase [Bacteroidales bacterium]
MDIIQVDDKQFSIYLKSPQIEAAVDNIAQQINVDLKGKNPLFLVVLNGAFIFASDLLKKITIPCEISFVKLSSYVGTKSTSIIRELIGLDEVVSGRTIVIVEDIIDTGLTMGATIDKMKKLEAKDVRIATLLFKPNAFQLNYKIDYIGINIPNDFIVGYGLDYNGYGRNYPEIYKILNNE